MTENTSTNANAVESTMSKIYHFVINHVPKIGADTLEWLTVVVLHCTTIPTMLALMSGLTDKTPTLDIVLFVWLGLVLMFARAILLKNRMNIVTNGAGFIAQSVMMALVLFK